MGGSVLTTAAVGALAPHLLPAFDIGRAELGLVSAVGIVGGAVVSPFVGRLSDRIGARRSLVSVFASIVAAFAVFAAACSYWVLLVGALVAGLALAGANPATNKLIVAHVEAGRRGLVTGIKQSGVPAGTFVGGVGLSIAAAVAGWRGALLAVAVLAAVAIPVSLRIVPRDPTAIPGPSGHGNGHRDGLGQVLAAYAFLIGVTNSATVFLPLYTVEELGVRPELGGVALSLVGAAAVAGRLVWARATDTRGHYATYLTVVAAGGAVAYGMIWLADGVGGWWLVAAGAVLAGTTASSWNSIAMLAVMGRAHPEQAGAASGTVMLGFYLGLGLGPPVQGLIVDHRGGYGAMWVLAMAASALAAAVAHRGRHRLP